MTILNDVTAPQLGRLLELFPIANLRDRWPALKGSKDQLCGLIAKTGDHAAISKFIDENLSCCKQHVYIFSHGKDLKALPDSVAAGERIVSTAKSGLYVIRAQYRVYLSDPLEEITLDFLWPLRLELRPEHLIARFVVLEKSLASHFNRPYHLGGKTVDEDDVLRDLNKGGILARTDLHNGIKKLWADGFMDCFKAKYRKPKSVASEEMDEAKGIREHNPDLYKILRKSTLLSTLFEVEDKKSTVSVISADPLDGFLGFPRYTEKKGDTNEVIGQIIESN
jgi:hypothetical protein